MLAVGLHPLEHATHFFRRFAVDAVQDQFGVAEDCVERRAQLVAHVGEELRLVLAGCLDLVALVLDLMKQSRVLDGQHRLRREGPHQVDGIGRKCARRAAAHHQHADDFAAVDERRHQSCTKAGAQDDLVQRRLGIVLQIGDLDWVALRYCARQIRIIETAAPLPQ